MFKVQGSTIGPNSTRFRISFTSGTIGTFGTTGTRAARSFAVNLFFAL